MKKNNKFFKAFSLAELMIVLLILTIILAASMPIMSKRAKTRAAAAAGEIWQYVDQANSSNIFYGDEGNGTLVMDSKQNVGMGNNINFLKAPDDPDPDAKAPSNAIVFGNGATTYGDDSGIAIGTNAVSGMTGFADGRDTIAIGQDANASSQASIAIGRGSGNQDLVGGSYLAGIYSISLGVSANNHDSMKDSTTSVGQTSIAIGYEAASNNTGAIAIGHRANYQSAVGAYSIAIGSGEFDTGTNTYRVGASASNNGSVAIGCNTDGSSCAATSQNNQIMLGTSSHTVRIPGNTGTALSVAGNTSVGGTLGVTGVTTLSSLSTTGNTSVGGTLGVTGATTLSSLSTGNTSVGGTLGATGATTLNSTLVVAGNTNMNGNVTLGDSTSDVITINGTLKFGPGAVTSGGNSANTLRMNGTSGQVYYNTYNAASDARLKNISGESKDGLDKIRQLKVYNYKFKKDKKKEPRVGVIAQDLRKVFPHAVMKGDDGYLFIRQEDMFYAMLNSIKQLDKMVQNIIKDVKSLASRVQKVEEKIVALVKSDEIENKKIKQLESENKQLKNQNIAFEKRLKKLEKAMK